jgi:hypothetical protein
MSILVEPLISLSCSAVRVPCCVRGQIRKLKMQEEEAMVPEMCYNKSTHIGKARTFAR